MLSSDYKSTRHLLMKMRKGFEHSSRSVDISPRMERTPEKPCNNVNIYLQIPRYNNNPITHGYNPFKSRYEIGLQTEETFYKQKEPEVDNEDKSKKSEEKEEYDNEADDNVEIRKKRETAKSADINPSYRYIGRPEKKLYTDKPDLRFKTADINDVKMNSAHNMGRKFKTTDELISYMRALAIYNKPKEIPYKHIVKAVDYSQRNYEPDYTKTNNAKKEYKYIIQKDTSLINRIDQMKQLLKEEAHVLFNHPHILRDTDKSVERRQKSMSKSPNSKTTGTMHKKF